MNIRFYKTYTKSLRRLFFYLNLIINQKILMSLINSLLNIFVGNKSKKDLKEVESIVK